MFLNFGGVLILRLSLKSLFPFVVQIIIFILCIGIISKVSSASTVLVFVLENLSYIILIIAMILSIWFNRGKVFFIAVFLVICEFLSVNYNILAINDQNYYDRLYPILGIIIPVNLLMFSQLKERGIFSFWGKLKLAFIAIEVFLMHQMVISNNKAVIDSITNNVSIFNFDKFHGSTMMVISYLIVLVFFIVKILMKGNSNEIRMIGVTIFTFLAFFFIKHRVSFSVFLSGAMLTLLIGIMEDSYLMAYMDELTGIPSRRALREMLMKLGNKYVIAMLDIDFFKKFNDTYGHDIGDEVLKLVAANLETVTGGGKAFRYGGEEFTIVFPGKTISEAVPHLEKLREQISKAAYNKQSDSSSKSKRGSSKQIFVTISIGVAEKGPKNKTTSEVMKAADNALYRAKKKGRNCVSK
jgi:diguanylate cyclase (GGDEF)-like protein